MARVFRSPDADVALSDEPLGDFLLLPNVADYPVIVVAALLCGAAATLVNPAYRADGVRRQLADSGAALVFATSAQAADALAFVAPLPLVAVPLLAPLPAGAVDYSRLLERGRSLRLRPVPIEARRDLALLPYSSGTTGLPKGVMLSHFALVSTLLVFADLKRRSPDDEEAQVDLGLVPCFHIYGVYKMLEALLSGSTLVLMQRFGFEAMLELLERHRITRASLVPPVILALAKSPKVDRARLHLRSIISGAAPLSADVAAQCAAKCGCTCSQGYGMTESGVTHRSVNIDGVPAESIGALTPNTEAMIVDAHGRALGVGQRGELWVRSPQAMLGYLNRPDETARTIDADGWLHTGDVAYVNERGHFFIVDRLKELIKYKGFQVAPAELEAHLLKHPAVADAAVVPLADAEAGEVPLAFVVLRAGAGVSAQEIAAATNRQLETFKHIRRIQVIDAIPKSASGKILRRELRARL